MEQPTRLKIIEAAYQQFLEHGYKQTTTKTVAELSGVNESTIFRIFDTKENLFHQSIAHYTSEVLQIDMECMVYGEDLSANLSQFLRRLLLLILETVPSFRLLVKKDLIEERFLQEIHVRIANLKHLFVQYLDGLYGRNMIQQVDFSALADLVFGQIFYQAFQIAVQSYNQPEQEKDTLVEEACGRLVTSLVDILATCPAKKGDEDHRSGYQTED